MPVSATCLLWCLLPAVLCADLIPRITFLWGDARRSVSSFGQRDVSNYDTFHFSPDEDTLYVGARDTLLSLNITDPGETRLQKLISWKSHNNQITNCISKAKSKLTECFNFNRVLAPVNQTHLYSCGTGAFSPNCVYIDVESFSLVPNSTVDARGQSPFDPVHKHTAIMIDGELYTGTMNNFQGNKPIIFRNLGNRTSLKTDESLGWLHTDAAFVASFDIQHPNKPSDGKVYFFFEETAKEFDFFEKLTVSRVARVCKSDAGGDKVLQRKWTTFLKAQLSCSTSEHFLFNVIHHAFYLPGKAIFYGVFTSQWQVGGSPSSAVCAFDLKEIENVFEGNFKELNKDSSRWTTYTGPISNPRPGSCTLGSSSDKELTFMKDHFLMDRKVEATGRHPLLVKQNVIYTRIAVDTVKAISGASYNVLFLGTDKGFLHKAVLVGSTSHIIEEIQLFQKPEPVKNLKLSAKKGVVYVGYSQGLLQVPLANCSVYRSCFDCILARDPYCAWDPKSQLCKDTRTSSELYFLLQDIEAGNPNETCVPKRGKTLRQPSLQNTGLVKDENITASMNSILQLRCPHVSAIANYSWTQCTKDASQEQPIISGEYLVIVVNQKTLGLYECWASEKGFLYQVARYLVMDVNGAKQLGREDKSGELGDGNPEFNNREKDLRSPIGNYWSQFVAVTVMLSLTLVGILSLGLYYYCERRRSKSKVQGCSTPEITKNGNREKTQEKTPLKSDHRRDNVEHKVGNCPESANNVESCCVPMESETKDMENNCVPLFASNGDASRDYSSKEE